MYASKKKKEHRRQTYHYHHACAFAHDVPAPQPHGPSNISKETIGRHDHKRTKAQQAKNNRKQKSIPNVVSQTRKKTIYYY